MVATGSVCALCGADAGLSPVVREFDNNQQRFCCRGCASVYEIAKSAGMLDDVLARPAAKRARLPDLGFGRSRAAYITVKGMWCAGCAMAAERILRRQPGVLAAEISFASERGRLRYDPAAVDLRTALKSLDGLGYATRAVGDGGAAGGPPKHDNTLLQLIAAVAFGMQVMGLFFVHLYPAYSAGQFDLPEIRAVQYLAWLLATPVLFFGGSTFLRGAWRALRARTATMDTLVALGTLSAYGYSVYFTLTGGGEVYFDSVTMITTFVVIGRYMETLGGDQARKDIRMLLRLQPDTAWLRTRDTWQEVSSAELVPGNTILVKPGERVPTEARIVDGHTTMDESLLTGESVPIAKEPGDTVFAGTLATDGAITCCVVRAPDDTRLAEIIRTVEATLAAKAPIQRLADTMSARFAFGILAVAAVTFFVWWNIDQSVSKGMLTAVAVLVVACPCALGLATPFALTIALGRATRAGILVRNLAALETAATARRIAFDKTGTLTRGRMAVATVAIKPHLHPPLTKDEMLCLAATAEQYSEHPLAKAILAACPSPQLAAVADFQAHRGQGVTARLTDGTGCRISVGTLDFAGENQCVSLESKAAALADCGQSIVWVGRDAAIVGFISSRDEPNAHAREALGRLDAMGIHTVMLSGDSPRTTAAIATELSMTDAEGGRTPIEKAERIRGWQATGEQVGMVGDGVNDAPALAEANLSIAMAGGADVAGQTSDLVLTRPDLTLVPWFVGLSRRARRIIRENLIWAFGYNLLMVPLAATGTITPIIAAGTMALSSLLVVANSLRLRR